MHRPGPRSQRCSRWHSPCRRRRSPRRRRQQPRRPRRRRQPGRHGPGRRGSAAPAQGRRRRAPCGSTATPTGRVDFVSSTDGDAMLDSDPPQPRRFGPDSSHEYGDAFGIDGTTSKAVVDQTLDSVDRRVRGPRRADRRRRPRLRWPGRDEPRPRPGRRLDRVGHHRRHRGARRRSSARPGPVVRRWRRSPRHTRSRSATLTRHGPWPSPLRPCPRARDRPGGRPTRLAVRGHATASTSARRCSSGTDRGEVALHFNDAPGDQPARL